MMQCTIRRECLLESLQYVVGVVEARQSIPILTHVLIELCEDTITMQCTDNELAITSRAPVHQVIHPGKATVSAYTFLEIVRRLPREALISLTLEGNQVLVQSDSSYFRLMSLSPEEFPNTILETNATTLSVSEKFLYEAIKTTHFAMAQNNPRYYLNGMLWSLEGGQLQVVATDAHRLAQRSIAIDSIHTAAMIVPRKTVIELGKLLRESSEELITIGFTENQLFIKGPSYQLSSRLIAGKFPDYKQLLPSGTQRVAIINRDLLREALSKLTPLVKQEIHKGVRLEFSKDYLKLRVSNAKQETGEASLAVQYRMQNDEPFSIAFNAEYLDKILDVLASGEIKMILPAQEGVTLLERCNNKTIQDHLYLIMPMLL
jgi:DNA polymerase-3 subunit beta